MTEGGVIGQRPSDARRKALAENITLPTVSNFFPIERYYEAADKLYASVQKQTANPKGDTLDWCYVLCRRYCNFCVEAIPEHNYYQSPKYAKHKRKHMQQVEKVVGILEEVAVKMDEEEADRLVRQAQERKEQERRLAQQKREKELRDQAVFDRWQQQQQQKMQQKQQQQTKPQQQYEDVEKSALAKLGMLQPQTQQQEPTTKATSRTRYRFVDSDEEEEEDQSSRVDYNKQPQQQMNGSSVVLPPPLLPPEAANSHPAAAAGAAAPPSYEAVVQRTNKYHSFFGPSQQQQQQQDTTTFSVCPPSMPYDEELPKTKKPTPPPPPPMRRQQELYKGMYSKYQSNGKIQVSAIDTYQGRISESTNGCTVISALVAAVHLNDPSPTGISNPQIVNVIDRHCGPILREIRRKLGLGGHALIIPSDVHDHLVDKKILKQEYFAGAAGGNIMDKQHYGEFLKLLQQVDNNNKSHSKSAATLFFREHVISIVKGGDNGTVFYDLIDSMPKSSNWGSLKATRTRCSDLHALEVLLLWYASSKFSSSNCDYIDSNDWDDTMADLDPRVFQGFVWST